VTYNECLDYLYSQLPMYHRVGPAALKFSLDNIRAITERLGHPETRFPSIHIAGTNGKGSCSHMLAAVLQSARYTTGLYTSPHIKDFRERIKINGQPIGRNEVVAFVSDHRSWLDHTKPSFFELTVALAFLHFALNKVDIAVIEVGLGGRLDSTNIIVPLLSVITNIGNDHNALLGNTLELIAGEKAGIIKPGVPVIIGERHPETDQVFIGKALEQRSAIHFAQDSYRIEVKSTMPLVVDAVKNGEVQWPSLAIQLSGPYQVKNVLPVLKAIEIIHGQGFPVDPSSVREGLARVIDLTGIKGRWQVLGENPVIICDTGHNRPAMEYILAELERIKRNKLHLVLGFVNDKDIRSMLEIMPADAFYYFCAANVPRSLDAHQLSELAQEYGINGTVVPDPNRALETARAAASADDIIFVGGSTFVVAELKQLN